MKTLFERWAETPVFGTMRVTPEEFDLLLRHPLVLPPPEQVVIGRHGVTHMAGNQIVSHRAYRNGDAI